MQIVNNQLRHGSVKLGFFHTWFWWEQVKNPSRINQINTSRGYFRVIVGRLDWGIATLIRKEYGFGYTWF